MFWLLTGAYTKITRDAFSLTQAAFLAFMICAASATSSFGTETRPRILFLSSYSPSFHSFFKQIEGFKFGLSESGFQEKDFILDVEFLDSKRFPVQDREQQLVRKFSDKFKKLPPYNLIVSADDAALKFVQKWRATLFNGTKVVFLGVNNIKLALQQNEDPGIFGPAPQKWRVTFSPKLPYFHTSPG